MTVFVDLVQFYSRSVGVSAVQVVSAVPGFLVPADAGLSVGDVVSYGIFDGAQSEVGRGTLAQNVQEVWILSRDVVYQSTNSGNRIDLSGSNEIVTLTLTAEDLPVLKLSGVFTANGTLGIIPADAMILAAMFRETAGHTVSVSLGSTVGGAEVLAATSVTANGIKPINGSVFSLQSWTADQDIFVASAAWNGASITASVWYLT